MKKVFTVFYVLIIAMAIKGQTNDANCAIFDRQGKSVGFEQLLERVGQSDVVFLGEQHDDAVAHAIQLKILTAVSEKYGASRKTVLSLEMFERDVQPIINEYLKNQITETHFLAAARPWGNYQTDYRPLVEFAKEKKLDVVAANAPRRYVNMVTRLGRASLETLAPEAKQWLAPLPYKAASDVYAKKFYGLMGKIGEPSKQSSNILDSQSLWDATMAYSIAQKLKTEKNALIVHLNGSFHTENRLGTVEHLLNYHKNAKVLVVTMRYEEDYKNFNQDKHANLGDLVVLTDARIPRSKK
jgi:uncharacterized iron-regulated protein